MTRPQDITNMQDLRTEIDRVDAALITLLAERTGYIDQAIKIKSGIGLPANIPERVTEVLDNVREKANATGAPPELAVQLWSEMIEFYIAREATILDQENTR